MAFSAQDVASQKGKTYVVTGANAGLGYETALVLADKGAKVVLACRSEERANTAMANIRQTVANADLHFAQLDLTDLDSVRSFAQNFSEQYDSLDCLINNAGVMGPAYTKTKDGFELQMGANYFGHFLLTGLLLDKLNKTPGARIVSLSSLAHLNGRINFKDIHWQKSYSRLRAYMQSKLACLMYSLELQKRLEQAGSKTISVAAHPGISQTELSRHIPSWLYLPMTPAVMLLSHSPKQGALPTLMAATDDGVQGGEYFGPSGFREMKGAPARAKIARHAKNPKASTKLWEISEELTGFRFPS